MKENEIEFAGGTVWWSSSSSLLGSTLTDVGVATSEKRQHRGVDRVEVCGGCAQFVALRSWRAPVTASDGQGAAGRSSCGASCRVPAKESFKTQHFVRMSCASLAASDVSFLVVVVGANATHTVRAAALKQTTECMLMLSEGVPLSVLM